MHVELIIAVVCACSKHQSVINVHDHSITVRLEKKFPFCYHCTFLKRCDRLRSVPFYYRSPFRFITDVRFASFAACV